MLYHNFVAVVAVVSKHNVRKSIVRTAMLFYARKSSTHGPGYASQCPPSNRIIISKN